MPACHGCYNNFRFTDLNPNNYCQNCAEERERLKSRISETLPKDAPKPKPALPATRFEKRERIMMTTETTIDLPISERLGIVTAEAVVGMNIVKDLMLDVRDLVGGQAKSQQTAMRTIKEELFNRMRDEAVHLNADMIVAVSLRFSDFGSRGSTILAAATGTAVRVEKE